MKFPIKKIATMAAVALALPLAAIAPAAQATYVQNWGYTVTTGFTAFADSGTTTPSQIYPSNPVTFNPDPGAGTEYATIAWGDPDGNPVSSLDVVETVTGNVATNGAFENSTQITHNNFTIGAQYETLATATILSQLELQPDVGENFTTLFNIAFAETLNSGSCSYSGGSPCDDIFVLLNPGGLTDFFTYDNGDGVDKYKITISVLGLGPITGAACETVLGAGNTQCIGFLTEESKSTTAQASFSITYIPVAVPTPGTLSILALGLACMLLAGFSRKRHIG